MAENLGEAVQDAENLGELFHDGHVLVGARCVDECFGEVIPDGENLGNLLHEGNVRVGTRCVDESLPRTSKGTPEQKQNLFERQRVPRMKTK